MKDIKKRHHPLEVNEVVFDSNKMLWGRILSIDGKYAKVGMRDQLTNNKINFDLDCENDAEEWDARTLDLYQIAEGICDAREGMDVCYEHLPTMDDYPYYSPYLDENLFGIEVVAR